MPVRKVVHEEGAPLGRGVKALLLILAGGAVVAATLLPSADARILAPLGAALLLAAGAFATMRFRLTEEGLEARMLPVIYRVGYGEIEGVELTEVPWYAGWGLRLMPGRKLAFVSRYGRAVRVRKSRGMFREVLMTPEEPERFAERLRMMAKKA